MCHQSSCEHFSDEDATAAEESLLVYCKPVELYNILHRRALHNPSFLRRCLWFKYKQGISVIRVHLNGNIHLRALRRAVCVHPWSRRLCLVLCSLDNTENGRRFPPPSLPHRHRSSSSSSSNLSSSQQGISSNKKKLP
ncbi:uncharacterized protein J3R85_013507 [Psidium guajava]|nr:uncharacterized protein J3R85_013507 [Psidium guajava]